MRYAGPRTGTGRPRKWDEPTIHVSMRLPYSVLQQIDEMTRPGISRTDVIVSLVQAASNAEVAKYILRIKELEMDLERERKENSELKRLVERLEERIRKLELELEKAGGKRSIRTYEEGKLLRTLAEHAREGISWADLCAEVLDLRDEKKMRRLMSLAFNVKKADKNNYESVFYPKRTAPEFQKWVLVRPNKEGPVLLIDYELWPKDVYEAAEAARKVKARAKANMVKKLKTGKAAERFLEMTFESIYRNYMDFIRAKQGKRAKEYLEEKVPAILVEKVFPEIAPEELRRAVLAVIQRHESDWNEAFVSNLRRVVMRTLSKPVEVKA